MPQSNRIDVSVWPVGFVPRDGVGGDEDDLIPIEFQAVNYISFVSEGTYGIPAILSDPRYKAEGLPLRVLYVNPGNIICMEAMRES